MADDELLDYVVTRTSTVTEIFGIKAAGPEDAAQAVKLGKADLLSNDKAERYQTQPRNAGSTIPMGAQTPGSNLVGRGMISRPG